MNTFLRGLLIGVTFTAILAWFALYQNNREWERQAYMHYAGIYVGNVKDGRMQWMWFDDYARTVLLPKAKERVHGTPSPIPKWEKI